MVFGYARISTSEQDNAEQLDSLREAGVEEEQLFSEVASGNQRDRPQLSRLLERLREDDVLVVWKLDRLTRSLRDMLRLLETLEAKGVGFRSITEGVDTTTPAGRMMMSMLGAFAQFERDILRERTRAGLEQARQEGRVGGRRPKLTPEQQQLVVANVNAGTWTAAQAARLFGVHRSTIGRLVERSRLDSPDRS